MAIISGANASSGIGTGQAQIYNADKSINTYARLVQQLQQQRAKEQKDLQEYLKQPSTKGLRDADMADYMKKYDEWRNTAIQSFKEKDQTKQVVARAEADKKLKELERFVNDSATYDKDLRDLSGRLLDDRLRNQFTDDAVERIQKSAKLPLSDPNVVRDFTTLARQVDTSKVLEDLSKVDNQLLKTARYANPLEKRVKYGNVSGTEIYRTRKVDPASQALNYAALYDTQRDVKAFIQREYKDLFDELPEDQAKAKAIQDLVKKRPVIDEQKPEWRPDIVDNFYAHELWKQRMGIGGDSKKDPAATYRQDLIGRIIDNDPNAVKELGESIRGRLRQLGADNVSGKTLIPVSKNDKGDVVIKMPNIFGTDEEGNRKVLKTSTTFTFNTNNREQTIQQLNSLMNEYSDEKIPTSALLTPSGKKKVPGSPGLKRESTQTKKETGMVTMVLSDGRTGQIPADKVQEFLKKYPKAKKR